MGNKIYRNYDLNVIFPIKEKKHIGYLSILLKYQLVDRLCFVDYDEMGVPVTTCENRENKQEPVLKMVMYEEECEVSLLDNLFNSLFYLLNPFRKASNSPVAPMIWATGKYEILQPDAYLFRIGWYIPISHTINPNQPVYDIQ